MLSQTVDNRTRLGLTTDWLIVFSLPLAIYPVSHQATVSKLHNTLQAECSDSMVLHIHLSLVINYSWYPQKSVEYEYFMNHLTTAKVFLTPTTLPSHLGGRLPPVRAVGRVALLVGAQRGPHRLGGAEAGLVGVGGAEGGAPCRHRIRAH